MRIQVFITAMLAALSVLAAPKFIHEDEFSKVIVGKTISSKTQKGVSFTAMFKSGETGNFQQKGKKETTFTWTFSDTTVCWDFKTFKECNKVEVVSPTSAKFYDSTSGKLNNAYTVK